MSSNSSSETERWEASAFTTTGEDPVDYGCTVADALEVGDEVLINNRTRPLEVQSREKQLGVAPIGMKGPDYPYKIVWLVGNGTRYRLRWSHLHEYRPSLHSWSNLRKETHLGEERIISDGDSESVHRIRFEDCETVEEQTDRVFQRMVDDRQLSADTDHPEGDR